MANILQLASNVEVIEQKAIRGGGIVDIKLKPIVRLASSSMPARQAKPLRKLSDRGSRRRY
jgi:hypothetical protein